jgi:MSHA pilin protein MshD
LQRGISLVELIMFIVIISVALVGILLVMNVVTSRSADPLIHKQALAVAESLLEEIKLQDLNSAVCTGALGQNAPRSGVGCVTDYSGYSTGNGILEFSTNKPVLGLEGYNITGVVMNSNLGTFGGTAINAGSAVEITVTVQDPSGMRIEATGYRAGK